MRRACAAAIVAAALLTAATAAETNDEVRDRVAAIDAQALYPTRLPSRLVGAEVSLESAGSRYRVLWDRGDDGELPLGEVALHRSGGKQLKRDLAAARARGFRPRKVEVGNREVWYLCGHVCGYEFKHRGFTYGIFGVYYDATERKLEQDLRRLLRKLRPAGE